MTTIPLGRDPTGIFRELTVDADGRLMVASAGGAGGPGQTLPLTTGVPTDGDQALVVTIKQGAGCMPVAAERTSAAIALGGNADSVVAVDNWTPVTSLLDAIRTSSSGIDAPTSDLLEQLESLATSAQGQATEATAQDARNQLLALLNRLPPALVNGALAVTVQGTVALAPGTTVSITGPIPLATGAATETTLASRATEATQAQVLGAVDTLEAGQATGNASLSTLVSRSPALVGGKVPVDASGSSVTASVSGTVNVGNFPSSQTVAGTVAVSNFPATQAVSGAVTVTNTVAVSTGLSAAGPLATQDAVNDLEGYTDQVEPKLDSIDAGIPAQLGKLAPAASMSVTLATGEQVTVANFPATQAVSGTVSVGNFPATQPVSGTVAVSSLPPLPSGTNAVGKVDQGAPGATAWKVDGSAVTQPISATALPLATGAATSALQTGGNASLTNIDGKLPPLGQQAPSTSLSVVLATGTTLTTATTTGERARTAVQVTAALTTTASQLNASSSASSSAGWEVYNPSTSGVTILVGDSANQAREVAPGDRMGIPSTTLAGWYAKTQSGTANVVLTGAV